MKTTRLAGVIRADLLKLINAEPFTARTLLDLVRVAKAAAVLLQATDANSGKKLKDMMPALLDDERENPMAPSPPGETYGVKILRDLMASIPKMQQQWQQQPPSAVRIETSLTDLTIALRAAIEDKNEPLAQKIQEAMAKMVSGPPAQATIKAPGVLTTPAGGVFHVDGWTETKAGKGVRNASGVGSEAYARYVSLANDRIRLANDRSQGVSLKNIKAEREWYSKLTEAERKRARIAGIVPVVLPSEVADMAAVKLPKKKTRGAYHQYLMLARKLRLRVGTTSEIAFARSWYRKLTENEREMVKALGYHPPAGAT